MFIPFSQLSPSARIWIYQLNRKLNEQETGHIEEVVTDFCEQWSAHGSPLQTSFKLKHDHFLILSVDENAGSPSGCSIDGSVRMLRELGSRINIDFFDRTQAAFLINGEVTIHPITKLKELFSQGMLSPSTITFNNLVATGEEFHKSWQVEVGQSWLARYLPKSTLARER